MHKKLTALLADIFNYLRLLATLKSFQLTNEVFVIVKRGYEEELGKLLSGKCSDKNKVLNWYKGLLGLPHFSEIVWLLSKKNADVITVEVTEQIAAKYFKICDEASRNLLIETLKEVPDEIKLNYLRNKENRHIEYLKEVEMRLLLEIVKPEVWDQLDFNKKDLYEENINWSNLSFTFIPTNIPVISKLDSLEFANVKSLLLREDSLEKWKKLPIEVRYKYINVFQKKDKVLLNKFLAETLKEASDKFKLNYLKNKQNIGDLEREEAQELLKGIKPKVWNQLAPEQKKNYEEAINSLPDLDFSFILTRSGVIFILKRDSLEKWENFKEVQSQASNKGEHGKALSSEFVEEVLKKASDKFKLNYLKNRQNIGDLKRKEVEALLKGVVGPKVWNQLPPEQKKNYEEKINSMPGLDFTFIPTTISVIPKLQPLKLMKIRGLFQKKGGLKAWEGLPDEVQCEYVKALQGKGLLPPLPTQAKAIKALEKASFRSILKEQRTFSCMWKYKLSDWRTNKFNRFLNGLSIEAQLAYMDLEEKYSSAEEYSLAGIYVPENKNVIALLSRCWLEKFVECLKEGKWKLPKASETAYINKVKELYEDQKAREINKIIARSII